jgi:hypothetical protein
MPLLSGRIAAWLAIGLLACATASAQSNPSEEPVWVESDTPPAPAFDERRLIDVQLHARSALRYGIDPATLHIGKDGVVRYVMVARSSTGAMTAMYEGLRCSAGEYKLYARFNAGKWNTVSTPEWKSLWESSRIQHPLAFARQGGCDGKAPPTSVRDVVRQLQASPGADGPY